MLFFSGLNSRFMEGDRYPVRWFATMSQPKTLAIASHKEAVIYTGHCIILNADKVVKFQTRRQS